MATAGVSKVVGSLLTAFQNTSTAQKANYKLKLTRISFRDQVASL